MMKVIIFNETKNLALLEDFLRYNNISYVLQKTNRELYFNNYFLEDINKDDVIILSNDILDLKREIRLSLSLKNTTCKFLPQDSNYYFANSNPNNDSSHHESTIFDRCTFPQGLQPILGSNNNSFGGKINGRWLFCLSDIKAELELAIEFLKTEFMDVFPYKTTCLRMFFEKDTMIKNLEDCLLDLSCKEFSWRIYNQSYGLFDIYLYYSKKIHDSTIAYIENVIHSVFNENIYADFNVSLSEALLYMASMSNLKIATAESLTGGLISDTIISNSGASKVIDYAFVTYSNSSKVNLLGVSEKTLLEKGAVSSEVAEQMALGLREKYGCDLGVSATGIAGPSGSTAEKPVGLVYVGIATSARVYSYKCQFEGDREQIRRRTTNFALMALLRAIKNY